MKFFKYNSFKFTVLLAILFTFFKIAFLGSFNLLIVSSWDEFYKNIIYLASTMIIYNILEFAFNRNIETSVYYIGRNLAENYSRKIYGMSFSEFKKNDVGEYISFYKTNLPMFLLNMIVPYLNLFFYISFIALSLIRLFMISKLVFLMAVIGAGLSVLIPILFIPKSQKYYEAFFQGRESASARYVENYKGIFEFITGNAVRKFQKKIDDISYAYNHAYLKLTIFGAAIEGVMSITKDLITVIIVSICVYLSIRYDFNTGYILSIVAIIPILNTCVAAVGFSINQIQSVKPSVDGIFGDMEIEYNKVFTKPLFRITDKFISREYNELNNDEVKEIETKDLVIKYDNKEIKIKDIKIEPGKKYAIVGESGCGKSSLIKTILGIHDNYEGKILINGKEKEKTKPLYDQIAYVGQETTLFRGSVEENIKLGNEKANAEELLQKVGLETIKKEEELIEGSTNISGGQKQRIGIARALAREKNIIFLDEVTSSLDKQSAEKIEEIMLNSDKTIVMITHKLPEKYYDLLDEVIEL